MTVREFENGYWYLDQLKNFAWRIGIPGAKKLRKDELEKATIAFLKNGPREIANEALTAQGGCQGR
jgi:SAP domain-containing protein